MRLLAIDVSGRDAELVADRCWQAGAAGLWEVDESTLRVGVDDENAIAFCGALADLTPIDVTDIEAVELAGRSVTAPMAGRDVDLWVPATVFGDASHPTTSTCLAFVDEFVSAGDSVLDVGSGTGALSIAAALRGAHVTAIDIDAEAVTTTADNAVRNGVTISVSATPLADVAGEFDVVVANMTIGSLGPLLPDIVRRVRPGGIVIVSGLLVDQWPSVQARLAGDVVAVRDVEDWVSAAVRC